MINVALICFDNPFLPPSEGGKKGMMSRIYSLLLNREYYVDLYIMNKRNEGYADEFYGIEKKVNSIHQYQMNKGIGTLLSRYPVCVKKRYVHQCIEDLSKKKYDIAIYEGEQVAAYRLKNKVNAKYHIIYMHDIESIYRKETASGQNNLILFLANSIESLKFKMIEKQLGNHFDRLWFVSKDECNIIGSEYRIKDKCVYIPLPAVKIKENTNISASKKLLYVGDLSIAHNYKSIKWFVDNIFSQVKRRIKDAELVIIGRISENDKKQLCAFNGVTVLGYVDNIDKAYAESCAFICPVLHGAGVKVKTIDALSNGQLVITNSKGAEGTLLEHGKHLIIADTENDMVEYCCNVLDYPEKYENIKQGGLKFIKEEHSIENQADIISSEIQNLLLK